MTQEFKETFPQGHKLSITDIPTVMKCKNIDYGHISWNGNIGNFYSNVIVTNTDLLTHLTNNIIDVHINGDNNPSYFSFISGVSMYSGETTLKYVVNNRCINNEFFERTCYVYFSDDPYCDKLKELIRYLTSVSLNKFAGFYNIKEYYNMMYTMLLVIKVQKILPKSIIKHLIIPFVYQ